MPNMFGGSQLDPEYAPWAKSKLDAKELKAIREIRTIEKKIDSLSKSISTLQAQKDKFLREVEKLQKKCRHRNITTRTGAYNMQYGVCVDCGKGMNNFS